MKLALIQQHATEDKQENIARGLKNIDKAAVDGAECAVFAELAFSQFFPQYHADTDKVNNGESIPGPLCDLLSEKAREHKMVIIPNLFEKDGDRNFDSSPVIDADGKILGVTRMVHIADYTCFYEKDYYTPGDQGAQVFDTAVGKIGVAICYDRHYPEYMRALGVQGAELVVVPQAGTVGEWPVGLYEAEMQVASFQNGYFCALTNRVGVEGEMEFSGESFITDPAGRIIAQAEKEVDEVLLVEIDLEEVPLSHARQLFFRDRRPDIYPLHPKMIKE